MISLLCKKEVEDPVHEEEKRFEEEKRKTLRSTNTVIIMLRARIEVLDGLGCGSKCSFEVDFLGLWLNCSNRTVDIHRENLTSS
jgi:hypothetical protein